MPTNLSFNQIFNSIKTTESLCVTGCPRFLVKHYLRNKYGKFIVRINDPCTLREDISNAAPVRTTIEISGKCNLEQVSYTKAEVTTLDLNSNLMASSKLIYTQKYRRDQDDCEYRYVLIATPPLSIAVDEFLYFDLGKPIPYAELF